MFKKLLVAFVLASVPVVVTGCGGSDKDAANGGDAAAAGDKSPLDQLKAINDDTQKQIDDIIAPVTGVDDIVA